MIFARDKSQMCNNLLQFAHVYAWGRKHGQRTISMRFSYKYPWFKIQNTKHCGFLWYLFAKYMSAIRLLPTVSFRTAENRDKKIRFMETHRHFVVSGWNARFYDEFLEYRHEICDLFQLRPEFSKPVDEAMNAAESTIQERPLMRLGVHIRRGDYKQWHGGKYYYDNETYAEYINTYIAQKKSPVVVYLSTNDKDVTAAIFEKLCPEAAKFVRILENNPAQDLYMLSKCDAVIGPPSTFSLTSCMYNDIPLCWMTEPDAKTMEFGKFETMFREIR